MIKSKCAKEPGMRPLVFLLFIVTATNSFTPSTLPSTLQPQPQTCNIGISTPTRVSPSYSSGRLDNLRFLDVHVKKCQPRSSSCLSMSATSASVATTTAIVTASTKARQFAYKKRFAIIMAFMTGWADFIFVKKFNFFPTMMTGNSLKMSYAMVDGRVIDVFFYLSIIFSYMMGVGIFRRAELSYKDKALNGLFAPLVTICFLMSDCLSWMNPSSKFVPAMLLSLAWGVINSVGSEVTGTLIFVVTGAMTRISNMIVDRISRTAGRKKIPKEGLLMSLSVIIGFLLGTAWSVFLNMKAPQLTSRGAFSIMGGIYGSLFLWLDRDEVGAWWSRKNGKLCEVDKNENCI